MKARDPDPARSVTVCEALGAVDEGILDQRDTYFDARFGRLKLREEREATPQLIAYDRPDEAQWRESRYHIIDVTQGADLRAALNSTLGVKVVVAKRRRLFRLGGAQIHLDRVEGLGDFIEFELAAAADSDLTRELAQLKNLREEFEISDRNLIGGSYSDLALASNAD